MGLRSPRVLTVFVALLLLNLIPANGFVFSGVAIPAKRFGVRTSRLNLKMDSGGTYTPSLQTVQEAGDRIRDCVHKTPVLTCDSVNRMADGVEGERHFFFKCELFQKVGAFKFRGASNAVRKYIEAGGKGPVVTHSSGNHAQALALAAKQANLAAIIVMPSNAPQVKVNAVREYGATIVQCKPTFADREETANKVLAEHPGSILIPPFDHPDIISGQGTLAVEFLEQVEGEKLDALIIPVGGGGMLSGCCLAAKGLQPDIRIFAAEPLGADDAARSFTSGEWVPQSNPQTCADGLRTSMGQLTWPIIKDTVEDVITVTEEEIIEAMRIVFMRMKLVIEPSAAVGVAVALSSKFRAVKGIKRVGIVLCGGNVDIDALPWMQLKS